MTGKPIRKTTDSKIAVIALVLLVVITAGIGCKSESKKADLSPEETVKAYIDNIAKGRVLDSYNLMLAENKKNRSIIDYWIEQKYYVKRFGEPYKVAAAKYLEPSIARVYVRFSDQSRDFDVSKEDGKWKLVWPHGD